MGDFVRHYIVGNDRPPMSIALVRALLGAAILGGAAALSAWSGTDNISEIVRQGLTAGFGFLVLRGAAEGWIDTRKNSGGGR